MRYVVLVAVSLLGAMVTGGVSPQLTILGAEPDLLLIIMLALMMREGTVTPVLVCSVAAIFMDVFYGLAIGYYSFAYLLTGLVTYAVVRKMSVSKILVSSLVCAGAWVFKELFMALETFLLGNLFDFFYILVHSTLPGILVNGILMLPIYLFFHWFCGFNFMRPRSISIEEEFPNMMYLQRNSRRR